MEDIVIGQIEDIEVKFSRRGKRYATVTIDGQIYSAWDKEFIKTYHVGDKIQFTYEINGKFANLRDIELIEPAKERPPNGDGKEGAPTSEDDIDAFLEYDTRKNRQIARLSCLRSATSIVTAANQGEMDLEDMAKYTIDLSKTFEKYVLNLGRKKKRKEKEGPDTPEESTSGQADGPPAGPGQEQDLPF
ncbi:MAG: hypothetical protein L0196_07020 [candidate division Zixibacteria bacterium]|nr:hypothetical protein [candidate division Zixibacteria bacterium]